MKLRLLVEYDGYDLAGWQIQPHARTVQGALEAALARYLGSAVRVEAAGRTDAGVHASGQVVCFESARVLDPHVVCRALNALTPHEIAIREVDVVPDGFDPRRHARSRTYVYRIWNAAVESPFQRRYACHVRHPLDTDAMAEAADVLVGEHDFTSFRAAGCDAVHPVRRVLRAELSRQGSEVRFEIEATAFLRHMVRNIVGTLVEVGTRKRAATSVGELLARRDRRLAGPTAPPHGLCLVRVDYGACDPEACGRAR